MDWKLKSHLKKVEQWLPGAGEVEKGKCAMDTEIEFCEMKLLRNSAHMLTLLSHTVKNS